jgi:hypothetical protein
MTKNNDAAKTLKSAIRATGAALEKVETYQKALQNGIALPTNRVARDAMMEANARMIEMLEKDLDRFEKALNAS